MNDYICGARQKLMQSLGEKDQEYLKLMRLWFRMKLTKEEFDNETRKLMTSEQIHLHNQLLLNLLNKCAFLSTTSPEEEEETPRKKYDYMLGNFEPLDPTAFIVTERQEVRSETPPYLVHDHLLPDKPFILSRLTYGARELGLVGSTTAAADLLLAATMQFLKNILTAIVCWRKGFKLDKHFLHGIGDPVLNPWLRSVSLHQTERRHCLKIDSDEEEILVPTERPTKEELEQEDAFKLSTNDCSDELYPISTYDLIATLKVYPNLLSSNFVHSVNSERIMARISHPSWDD